LEIGTIINSLNPPLVTAFTATASAPVLEKINGIFSAALLLIKLQATPTDLIFIIPQKAALTAIWRFGIY